MKSMKTEAVNIFVRRAVGANAARLREARGITQSGLARMVDANRSYVNQFEAGKQNISVDYLVKLADGLDVPMAEFFSGLEGSSPSKLVEGEE